MKKYLYLFAIAFTLSQTIQAAPGDTTWVQANNVEFTHYGNFDTTITFPSPGTTYRRIYMILTLGKYMCPAGSTYCGDWDYTVQNYLMTPGGDTLELGRLITPYANAGAPRTPWSWTQHYVYDVTDYAMVLQGSATMRINYSGYSWGFTGDLTFAFIEGTPDRTVYGINRLWNGYFNYGDTAHSDSFDINTHYPTLNFTAPAHTQSAEMKYTVTGHGSDGNYCNEFCDHSYYVYLNSAIIDSYSVWRPDCGMNELYPQSGTWLYERANWCPGALVYSQFYNLPGITAGAATNVDIRFQPYISSGGAGYAVDGNLFFYGGINKTIDASLDQIVAPTNDENFFRENPTWGTPVVYVKNTGATTIDSITLQYGIKQSATMQTYTWYGSISPLTGTQITLPDLHQIDELAAHDSTTGSWDTATFIAEILKVNGVADNDQTNDTLTSQFASAPKWPTSIRIDFKTNNEAIASGSNICETSWIIYDADNNIFQQRANANISTMYIDTVNFWHSGFYRLQVYDSSCDGLQWWANSGTGITSGYLYVKPMTGLTDIPMHGYNYGGTYNNDFGCGFTQYFYIQTADNGIRNISSNGQSIEAYPNPAQNYVNVAIAGLLTVNGEIRIIDALGRTVSVTNCNTANQQIDVSKLATGLYTIVFVNTQSGNELETRLLITK